VPDDLTFIPLPKRKWNLRAYVWLAPALAVLLPLLFLPWVWAAMLSLQDYDPFAGVGRFVWLRNYYSELTSPMLLRAVLNTVYFDAVFVPGTLAASLVLAVLLHRRPRGASGIKAALFASLFVSLAASGIAWRTLYSPANGLVNGLLGLIGVGPVDFLRNPRLALPAIAAMNVWRWLAPCTIILLAGMRRIPNEIYDLAATDGASRWDMVRHVTLPMLHTPGIVCTVLLVLVSLRSFEEVYVMTLDGGPATWSTTMSFLLYRGSMEWFDLARTMTVAVMVALTIGLGVFLLYARGWRYFTSRRIL